MSLRLLAEKDMGVITQDLNAFGWQITLTSPAGQEYNVKGLSNDISQIIDPDTGQAVSGRLASIALQISALEEVPKAIINGKPWLVTFDDINGNSHTFKILQANPDRALGILTCQLEVYK